MGQWVSRAIVVLATIAVSSGALAGDAPARYVSPGSPPIECVVHVNNDANPQLPGYLVKDPSGKVCVPFSYRTRFAPPGYQGDYFVDEFTDARIKARYAACRQNPACNEKLASIPALVTLPSEQRVTGAVDAAGRIDPHGKVDLKRIRRPAYFAKPAYHEPIGEAEGRTYTVEFQVPREAYERLHMQRTDPVALRGWYLEGKGVPAENGQKTRALVVLSAGRSVETTAIHAADEPLYDYDKTKASYVPRKFPNATTEKWGLRYWRNYLYELNRAGFDVLTFDKRGHGISGGYNDVNTLEQGRDMWRALDALETGEGVRALSPSGKLIAGAAVRGRFLAGMKAKQIPILLGGPSQGSITTMWAMHQNFVEDCTYDLPDVRCSPAHRYNVKGALLLAAFDGAIGNRPAPTDIDASVLDEGRSRVELNTVMMPSSEPLANIDKWPAVFFGRGLWDFAQSLEATLESYNRVKGLKELVVVRAPHSDSDFGDENVKHMTARMVAFSKAALFGQREVPGSARFQDLKSLVASSPAYWDPTNDPGKVIQQQSTASH